MARRCKALMVKNGEPCQRPADNLSELCGYHSKREQSRRSVDASAQWEAGRLRVANEVASDLVCSHRMVWCRARLFHALAGAAEQGKLIEVLVELFSDSIFAEEAVEIAAVAAGYVGQMWPANKEGR